MPHIKTASGINWFYEVKGEGRPLVFLHGWSFDSGIWSKQADYFSEYKIVALDLPGHGQSEYKEKINIAEELNFIFGRLGLKNANLVGHSLGGLMALKLAVNRPDLVDKIILVSTNVRFVRSDDYAHALSPAEVERLQEFLKQGYLEILPVFMRWLFTEEERSQADFRSNWDLIAKRKIWPKQEALSYFLSFIAEEDLRSELNKINSQTLIVCGTNDPICPVGSAQYLGKNIKNSKVKLLSSCGHLPFLTESKRFNGLAQEFLK
jgi:pimeloyl-[acyl-carrier protein] methyl ester esterase